MTVIVGGITFALFLCGSIKFEMFVICFLLCVISDTLGMIRKDMKDGKWS